MHVKAQAWNNEKYPHLNGKTPDTLIPFDRPCDWCGEIVDIGYIHKETCWHEEVKFYLEIFYG